MDLYFITVSLAGLTSVECNDVHRRVVSLIHDHNTHPYRRDRVAIAYPDYRLGIDTDATEAQDYGEEQRLIRLRKGFLGKSVRLIGLADGLQQLDGSSLNDVDINDPRPVPSATSYGCYIAYKGMTKLTPSRLRRAITRRAWERDPVCLTPAQLERRQVEQRGEVICLPNVGVRSRTNQQSFSIFIKQTASESLRFAPNPYGFSTNTQVCSIPVF